MEWLILYIKKDQSRHNELSGMTSAQAPAFQLSTIAFVSIEREYSRNHPNAHIGTVRTYIPLNGGKAIPAPSAVVSYSNRTFSANRNFFPGCPMHVRTEQMLLHILEYSSGCPVNRPVRGPVLTTREPSEVIGKFDAHNCRRSLGASPDPAPRDPLTEARSSIGRRMARSGESDL